MGYQGIVRTIYGVDNSQTLISWDKINYCKNLNDYGYGSTYDFNYGYGSKYFFGQNINPAPTIPVVKAPTGPAVPIISIVSVPQVVIAPAVINTNVNVATLTQTDLLCSYWDGSNCLSCYGDYYADTNGNCVKI